LSEVCDAILGRFKPSGEVYEFFLLDSSEHWFGAYVFYRWDRQIEEAEKSGLASRIKEVVYEEMVKVGRGPREAIRIDFEFDSHENVERDYEGDYFLRLR
jgi:hypothetical protein